jgi:hypothetical protein
VLTRTWHLARARLAMARRSGWPIPACVFLATLAAVLALLVRDVLPAFPYVVMALSAGGLFLAFPLLSDLGALLRRDEGAEWVGALPALAAERALARMLHLVLLLGGLVVAWFTPWAVLAPGSLGLFGRLFLPVLGLAQALLLATLVVTAQATLLARLEMALVLLESALVAGVVVALVQLLGHLPELARLEPGAPGLAWFPPAWFARPLFSGGWTWAVPAGATAAALGILLATPASGSGRARRLDPSERWLEPFRRAAARAWVRPEERGAFDLVYLALPREREVALRTTPLLGIPLAFLLVRSSSAHGEGAWRADLLALLLFTAGVYLPLLLTHVPLSESHGAAWILRTAPCAPGALTGGAIKALFVRYLVPLYASLLGLGLLLGETGLLVRLWLPALLLALLLLRLLYPTCVRDLPLSVAPEELRSDVAWAGLVAPLAVGLTLLAVVANRFLDWRGGLGSALLLGVWELLLERRQATARLPRGARDPRPAGAGVIPPYADD